uniref:Gx transporter family protein n=1 Tax=Anaerococcus mediterraneensis TaxID=1870984 RepID=UPI00093128B1|nr:Gx transporter family protein [Anaerococcus mediterraneensis]
MQGKIKKLTNMGLLVALALVISLIELQIPVPVPIPGAKLGLSNIIILASLYLYGFRAALTISLLKSFMLVLITGAVTSFFYSAAGAILASIAMYIALKFHDRVFSFIGVSEIGAFAHNLGQIIVASIIMENIKMFYYFPLLVFVGTFSGLFVGLSSNFIISHMKKIGVGEKIQ